MIFHQVKLNAGKPITKEHVEKYNTCAPSCFLTFVPYYPGTKNIELSISLLRNALILISTRMKIGTFQEILFQTLIVPFRYAGVTYGPFTYLSFLFAYTCRLKDKYHPTNLLSVIERWSCILCEYSCVDFGLDMIFSSIKVSIERYLSSSS
jgi:hypothetical protein